MNPEEEAQFIENRRLVSRAIKILSSNTNQNHRHRVSQLRILFGVTSDKRLARGRSASGQFIPKPRGGQGISKGIRER